MTDRESKIPPETECVIMTRPRQERTDSYMIIRLDAAQLNEKTAAHAYLKEKLQFPAYYGGNLDALHDCLTEVGDTWIHFEHMEAAGAYFWKVYRVFRDSSRENGQLRLIKDPADFGLKNRNSAGKA